MNDRGSVPDSVPCPDGFWSPYSLLPIGIEALPLAIVGLRPDADQTAPRVPVSKMCVALPIEIHEN